MARPAYALLALLIACGGGGDDDDDIPDQILSGVVGGVPWEFAQGQVELIGSATGAYTVGLYGDSYDECGLSGATAQFLLTKFAPEVGSYPFDLQQNLTFVVDEGGPVNKIATDGLLILDAVTPAFVTGRVRARFDADNDVAGSFQVPTCITPEAPVTLEVCGFNTPPPLGDGDPTSVQRVAAAPDGRLALIDATGTVLTYVPISGPDCSLALTDTIVLPSPAVAIDYDAAGLLYIHTSDVLYRYDGPLETLLCDTVSAADGLAVTADGATAYSKYVNSASRIAVDAASCTGAVWTPANAFGSIHDIAVIDDGIYVGGRINNAVQVVAFDDAGTEQLRFGADEQLAHVDSLAKCGADYCLLSNGNLYVYDQAGALRGSSLLATRLTVQAGFVVTDLAFPPGGGSGYLGVSAQRAGSFDVEAQIYRVDPE